MERPRELSFPKRQTSHCWRRFESRPEQRGQPQESVQAPTNLIPDPDLLKFSVTSTRFGCQKYVLKLESLVFQNSQN